LSRFTSPDHLRESLSGNSPKLGSRRVGRLVVEETGKLGMVDDHRRIALNSVVVFFLEGVARFRGHEHFPSQGAGAAGVFGSDRFLGRQSFINAHDKLGDVVQPGELRVVDDQPEKLTGVDIAVFALVIAALHVQKGLVELEKCEAEGEKFLAGGGVVVRGI